MAARLLEMRRVLKPTGSLYLHCDPTMSHYLKLVLDSVFGRKAFRTELVWKRMSAHNDTKQGRRQHGRIHDVLLFYAPGRVWTWNPQYTPYTQEYLEGEYRHTTDAGRRFKQTDLTAAKPGGDTLFEWRVKRLDGGSWEADLSDEYQAPRQGWQYKGVRPYTGRYWAYSRAQLREFWLTGRLYHRSTGTPRLMQFADEMPGIPLQDLWNDIAPALGEQRTAYPTQKPLALLDRIIRASSNPGDVVLDPFCGCATACIAAEKLGRDWAGIDISPKAAELVRQRMRDELRLFYHGAHRTDIPSRTDLGKLPRHNSLLENRKRLYGEQAGHCAGCNDHFEARHLEVDHIIARRKGGTDSLGNLQLLCGNCNRIKGDRGMEYLRTKLQLLPGKTRS
jgi:hypothetical protein